MSKLIKRDWRNWKPQQTPSGKRFNSGSDSFQSLGEGGFNISKAVKPKAVKKKTVRLSGVFPTALKNNSIKTKPARTKLYGSKSILKNNNFKFKANSIQNTVAERNLENFDDHLHWSSEFEDKKYNHNSNRSFSVIEKADETRDRRLSGALAIMISKLAADKSGEPIIGEDEWDVQELMMRSITRRNIYSCMQSRERENIVLVLDSSPSCRNVAKLYSKIAFLSCKLGNLDIYLAPNARITHKMSVKNGQYEKVFDVERDKDMIVCGMDALHNFFNNRVILFFGDYDGTRQICSASYSNEIYWLNNSYDEYEHKDWLRGKKFNGTVFDVSSRKDLINTIRKLR